MSSPIRRSLAASTFVLLLALSAIALWSRADERLDSLESGARSTVDHEVAPVELAGESTTRVGREKDARRTVDAVPAEPVPATPGTESTSLVVQPIWVDGEAPAEGAVLRLVPDGWGERSSVELGADGRWTVDRSQLGAFGAELALRCPGHWIDGGQWLLASATGVRDLRIYTAGSIEVTVSGYAEGVERTVAVPADRHGSTWGDLVFEGGTKRRLASGLGVARFEGLRVGVHQVLLFDPTHGSADARPIDRRTVVVRGGATTKVHLDAADREFGAVLTGRVLRGGEPVAGYEVRGLGFVEAQLVVATCVSDEHGVYLLELAAPGWFEVRAGPPGPSEPHVLWTLHVGRATYQDLEMPGGSLVAALTGFGVPVSVSVRRHESEFEALGREQRAWREAADGDLVVVEGLESGRYEVQVRPRQGSYGRLAARIVEVLEDGPPTRVELAATATHRFDVRVVDRTGAPADSVNVYWRLTGPTVPDWHRLGRTDDAGLVSGQVPQGVPLLLQVERRAAGMPLQAALASRTLEVLGSSPSDARASDDAGLEPFEIRCEAAGALVVSLESAGASVQFDALLFEPDGSRPVVGGSRGFDVERHIETLAPGPYDLVARDITGRIYRRRVVVEAGSTTRVTLP
ncbi:hypothetical protein Pla163_16900 [Planctomycetes bacterium Pla163]|uniref:Uncharacterized protein n=1 Tax=Rohdeia mirabilis TaxID=2528008 RepID=A0A518CZC4_9BACT|nr:hypothetical protein Pla163_16900 [Planctomycetes bacterium Pla163]